MSMAKISCPRFGLLLERYGIRHLIVPPLSYTHFLDAKPPSAEFFIQPMRFVHDC